MQTIDAKVKAEIDEATKAAKADSEIGLAELTTDVYAKNLEGDLRGTTPNSLLKHETMKRAVNL